MGERSVALFLPLNVPCSKEITSFFPIGKWREPGEGFCQILFQKCVLGKVKQAVKQHFDHVMVMKSSSENNANELPWNSFFHTVRNTFFPLATNASERVFRQHQTEISLSSLLSSSFPSLYKVNSRSPSGRSQIVSGPGQCCRVASLCSEYKRRLLCAHIKGGLSNLGLALC